MLAKRIKEGLLSALREEIMEEGLDEMLDEMQEENTDSKSEVVAESTNEMLAVKTMKAVVEELRRGKRIKIGKKTFGE